jgi:ACS family tartrate transporter-like MFS transporter
MEVPNSASAVRPGGDLTPLSADEQTATLRKINLRLIPLLFVCYVIAYIDRINVGFAKLHLQAVLGVDPLVFNSVYGFGAGLFFVGYFIFEVPSNLILQKVGARIWIARIMIVWGIVSMCFMFLKGVTMFYVMRFLLGAAEAGFFPGVLLYMTYWYPARDRARTIAMFVLGGVAAGVVGSPISGALLSMDGIGGLKGWQWLFFLEALPAIILGIIVLCTLPNRPKDAKWLSEREKTWVHSRLEADANATHAHGGLWATMANPRVWLFCAIYFCLNVGTYGFEMWSPSIVKELSGGSDTKVGILNGIPYFMAAILMYWTGKNSDRTGERRWHIAILCFVSTIGFIIGGTMQNAPLVAMIALTIAYAGLKSTIAPFWAFNTTFMTAATAAGAIALINSVGNLGGWAGPFLVGYIKDKTGGSNLASLLMLGGAIFMMGVLILTTPKTAPKVTSS